MLTLVTWVKFLPTRIFPHKRSNTYPVNSISIRHSKIDESLPQVPVGQILRHFLFAAYPGVALILSLLVKHWHTASSILWSHYSIEKWKASTSMASPTKITSLQRTATAEAVVFLVNASLNVQLKGAFSREHGERVDKQILYNVLIPTFTLL